MKTVCEIMTLLGKSLEETDREKFQPKPKHSLKKKKKKKI